MSYEAYKVLHLVGIFMILMPLSAVIFHVALGGDRKHQCKRPIAIIHGLGMLITIVAGFGLLARLHLMASVPVWAWMKLGIWLILGALIGLAYRLKSHAWKLWWLVLGLATTAGALAIFKP